MSDRSLTNIPRDIFSAAYRACRAPLRALPQAWRRFRIALIGTGSPPVAFRGRAQFNTQQKAPPASKTISEYKIDKEKPTEYTLRTTKLTLQKMIEHSQNIIDSTNVNLDENRYLNEDKFRSILEERISSVKEAIAFISEINRNYESTSEMKFLDENILTKKFVSSLCSALVLLEVIKSDAGEYCKDYNKDTDERNKIAQKYVELKRALDAAKLFQQGESYESPSAQATDTTIKTLISLSKAMINAINDYEAILESPAQESVLAFREQSQNLAKALSRVTNLLYEVRVHFDLRGFDLAGDDEDIDLDEADLRRRTNTILPAAEMLDETTLNHRRPSYNN